MWIFKIPNWIATSPAIIVSLFLLTLYAASSGQELSQRASAKNVPISIQVPQGWEVFNEPKESAEVLFLQTPEDGDYEATASLTLHPTGGGNWSEVVKRQTYHLLVWQGVPIITNEELKLRGMTGHKWVYQALSPNGEQKVYYRFYLLLPPSIGKNRLLLLQGAAPAEHSLEMIPLFNSLARSLSWGLDQTAP